MTRRLVIQSATLLPTALQNGQDPGGRDFFVPYWTNLTNSYFKYASGVVCDYPNATILEAGLSRSGKCFTTVARMLPGLAAWVASGRDTDGKRFEHLLNVYQNAFDPKHADYWKSTPQADASMVAWVVWLLRDRLPGALTPSQRSNLQEWLQRGEPDYLNHAIRIQLSENWKEFHGDELAMLAALRQQEDLHLGGGWYGREAVDYESFWLYASKYLYWREVTGGKYQEWTARFDPKIRDLMRVAPLLMGANGSQPLAGASLVDRWAFITPNVLAYRQGLWPHSPGLLRRLVRRNIDFFWRHGGFAAESGRLNEMMSDRGTHDFPESYIDGGHPYWCMQAFAFFLIPREDSFWTSAEEKVPSERRDSQTLVSGPNLLITNVLSTGDVRLHHASSGRFDAESRDRYAKFSYSARFPFCYSKRGDRATWDSALVIHDPATGTLAGRAGIHSGKLIDGGIETDWWIGLDGLKIRVLSQVFPAGETECRVHRISCPPEAVTRGLEIWEGSIALPVSATEPIETTLEKSRATASAAAGTVGVVSHEGYRNLSVETDFKSIFSRETINIIAPRTAIATLRASITKSETTLKATFLCRPSLPKGGYK